MEAHAQKLVYADETTPRYDLVISLGTDHHIYDRAAQWIGAYLEKHPDITCFFQHGFTTPPPNATETANILPRAEMLKLYEVAGAAVVHGGPGCILDVRATGKIPFTLPRRPWLGEHVDEHQVKFTEVMDSRGEAVLIRDFADLEQKLDAALADPSLMAADYRVSGADQASDNLKAAIEAVMGDKTIQPRRFVRRWKQVIEGIVAEKRAAK